MSHLIIIRGGEYAEEGESAELKWTPDDNLTDEQEAELFKKKLKIYKKAVGMPDE